MLRKSFVALAGAAVLFSAAIGESCSRVLWNNSGQNVLVGRNMDWFEDLKTNFYYLPRGLKHSGLSAKNPAQWTNKYGSVLLTAYDAGVVDGVNEKGLSVNVLYLQETKTAPRDESIPGLCISMWGQYYLDQFATVKEAVEATHANPYQLQMATEPGSGKMMTVHLALNDPTGDSAIIECLDGKLKVYHSRDFTVMTNSPTFDKQLELLKQYEGFGGDKPLPGSSEAADRFVRGAYYAKQLPKAKSERDGIAALMSVMRNVSAPYGVSDPFRPNISTTLWRTISDLDTRVIYYDSVVSPQIFWVDVKKIDFSEGQPVRKLTVVGNFNLMGDVTDQAVPTPLFTPLPPDKD